MDNLMHNLQADCFYQPDMLNGMTASADGPIKTIPCPEDSPLYLHDGAF
jgi:hypothetical protein